MNLFWTFIYFGLSATDRSLAPLKYPTTRAGAQQAVTIPNAYIVRLKAHQCVASVNEGSCRAAALEQHRLWLNSLLASSVNQSEDNIKHIYSTPNFHGYAGTFDDKTLESIRRRPEVDYVEVDSLVHVADYDYLNPESHHEWAVYAALLRKNRRTKHRSTGSVKLKSLDLPTEINFNWGKRVIQRNAPWGLCRLSNKHLPRVFKRYSYPQSAGKDVDAYVIDTGISTEHVDFEGRARWGTTIPLGDESIDGNGHGTHVSGTIVGRLYGVAKGANVIAVKVLRSSGFGTNSDVIKGVEWVMKQHLTHFPPEDKNREDNNGRKRRGSVANMSLGGGKSVALEDMVNEAVKAGIHFAVAAGNDGEDSCDFSPAAASLPITVGAINKDDEMASFSNRGKCVDIFAPGVDIVSTWLGSPYAVNTLSGTSMATPHVAGVIALHVSEMYDHKHNKPATPAHVKRLILNKATKGVLNGLPDDGGNTPNALINTEHLMKNSFLWSKILATPPSTIITGNNSKKNLHFPYHSYSPYELIMEVAA